MLYRNIPAAWLFILTVIGGFTSFEASAQLSLSIITQIDKVEFSELEQGRTLNRETGSIKGSGLSLQYRLDGGFFAQVDLFSSSGQVDYIGYTQLGALFATETEHYQTNYQGRIGRSFSRAAAYIGAGRGYSERNILSTQQVQGLYEEWQQDYALAGLDLLFMQSENSQIRFDVSLQQSLAARILVEISGLYDSAQLTPGRSTALTASVSFSTRLPGNWSLTLQPQYQTSNTAKSRSQPLYRQGRESGVSFHHPRSQREFISLRCNLTKFF